MCPAATSSGEEDDESARVIPVEATAAVELAGTNAAVATETERPTEAKDPAGPELKDSTAEAADNEPAEAKEAAKTKKDADASETSAVLPVTTLGSSCDGSSSSSDGG